MMLWTGPGAARARRENMLRCRTSTAEGCEAVTLRSWASEGTGGSGYSWGSRGDGEERDSHLTTTRTALHV
jgi:hypothetical protein